MSALAILFEKGWISCPECDSDDVGEVTMHEQMNQHADVIKCHSCGYQDKITEREAIEAELNSRKPLRKHD